MKYIFAVAACLALALPARADELRIARFDAKRVFDGYQHTKDLKKATLANVHVGGPGSYTRGMERTDKIKDRHENLGEQVKAAVAGSPEREELELQLQVAALELQLDELRRALQSEQRGRTLQEEARRQRDEVLAEIWSAASRLSAERGYHLLIPDNLPTVGPFPSIVVSGDIDDLTEPLLQGLNEQYAARQSK